MVFFCKKNYFNSMHPSHSKIAYGMSLSCQPTLLVSGWSISTIFDHGGPSQSPKTSRDRPKRMVFLCSCSKRVVCTPSISILHMECLCHVNLPFRCQSGVYHPSVTMGAPLRAPKQAEIRPKQPSFPLSML